MILAEQRQHRRGGDGEEISLSGIDVATSWQQLANGGGSNSSGTTIEETAVVHQQPNNRQIAQVDDDDRFSYPSSSSEEEEDEDKKNWVAKTVPQLPELPQLNVNNQVTGSNRVNINNKSTTVFENLVIKQEFYNVPPPGSFVNHDRIDVAPMEKIANGKEPEVDHRPKLSNASSHPLYPFAQDKVASWCTKRRLIAISAAVLVGIVAVILIVYFTTSEPTFHDVCIVPRVDWTAEAASDEKDLAVSPAKYVIIMHTRTVACFTQSQCANTVKSIQWHDMKEMNKTDISYNWLVGGDGLVYTGRGWNLEGDHTKNYDNRSIGIGFIGNFDNESPSKAQIDKGEKLIKRGVNEKKISKDYILVGQKQCILSSNNPGKKLYDIIKTWDNWSPACF